MNQQHLQIPPSLTGIETPFPRSASAWVRLRTAVDLLRHHNPAVSLRAYVWFFQGTAFDQYSFDQLCLEMGINPLSFRRTLLQRYASVRRHHSNRWSYPVGVCA